MKLLLISILTKFNINKILLIYKYYVIGFMPKHLGVKCGCIKQYNYGKILINEYINKSPFLIPWPKESSSTPVLQITILNTIYVIGNQLSYIILHALTCVDMTTLHWAIYTCYKISTMTIPIIKKLPIWTTRWPSSQDSRL